MIHFFTNNSGVEHVDSEKIWSQADHITFHLPLEPSTKNLINKQHFEKVTVKKLAWMFLEPSRNKTLLSHPAVICLRHLKASIREE